MPRHAQLLANDKCLLVVDDPSGNLMIYCERMSSLDTALRNRKHRKILHRDKIGQDLLLTFDETKRMLAVCVTEKVRTLI